MGIVVVAFLAARAASRRGREEHIDLETDQLISQRGEPVELTLSVSILDSDVFALNIAEFTEAAQEYLALREGRGSGTA